MFLWSLKIKKKLDLRLASVKIKKDLNMMQIVFLTKKRISWVRFDQIFIFSKNTSSAATKAISSKRPGISQPSCAQFEFHRPSINPQASDQKVDF